MFINAGFMYTAIQITCTQTIACHILKIVSFLLQSCSCGSQIYMPQFLFPVSGHGHDFGPKFIVKDKENFRLK